MAKNMKFEKSSVGAWLKEYIYKQVEDEDCIDNLRWAKLGDIEQMNTYNMAVDQGCCGFFDGQVTAPDGNTYVVGCNFGH